MKQTSQKQPFFQNERHFEIWFSKKKTITFFWSKLSKLHKKDPILHMTTTFSLKQGETRTSSRPISHPLGWYCCIHVLTGLVPEGTERWARGCAAENGGLFLPSGFTITPYFCEKRWFSYRVPFSFLRKAYSLRIRYNNLKHWTENYWSEGKIENLVWIWVANLVLWFGYRVVVEIFRRISVPKKIWGPRGWWWWKQLKHWDTGDGLSYFGVI